MYKNILTGLVCAVLLAAAPLSASAQFEVKTVAVVDIKRIIDDSAAAKTAQKEVTALKDKYFKEIKNQDTLLQKRQKELMDQKKALSADAFNKKVGEFKTKVDQERAEVTRKQKIVETAFVKSLELIRDETMKVVKEVAAEKNIDIVIPTSQLLHSKEGLDITDEVLTRLNKRLTKVDINVKGK